MSADDLTVWSTRRFHVEPGDVVAVLSERVLHHEQGLAIKHAMQTALPPGTPVVVLDGGMQVAVIGPADTPMTKIRDVLAGYEKALANREHGGVAAGRAIDAIATIMEGAT